jgi:glutathione S-transferase
MRLHYFETPNARQACAVARHLALPVEFVRVDLTKGEQRAPGFLAVNPNGKVPALEDGGLKLWEASAIMVHLAVKAGSDLWPAGGQVEVVRWLSWNQDHFSRHAGVLFFEHLIKRQIGAGDPDPKAVAEATGFFRQFGRVLDDHLDGRRYLVGEALSVADFAVGSRLPYADSRQAAPRRVPRHPALARSPQRAAGLARAFPDRQCRGGLIPGRTRRCGRTEASTGPS